MENFPTFLQIFPCKDFTFLYKAIILSYILQKISCSSPTFHFVVYDKMNFFVVYKNCNIQIFTM